MSIGERLLPEFDHEMAGTRKVLERIPLERYDWTPHPKSFSLGRLANHLAGLLRWGSGAMSSRGVRFRLGWLHSEPVSHQRFVARGLR